ncbi:hypothetical protein, partial [Acinetobacter baumannii]
MGTDFEKKLKERAAS